MQFLFFTSLLFLIATFGMFLIRKHLIIVLMCLELLLLACNLNFIIFSFLLDDFLGQVFAFYILSVAAAEAAIGLALVILFYRLKGGISVNFINLLKA